MKIQVLDDLIPTLEPYFTTKAPFQIPTGGREFIVKVAPWVVLIVAILLILPLLGLIVGAGLLAIFSFMSIGAILSLLALILAIAAAILYIMSYSGIKNHQESGWRLVYYSSLVSAASTVLSWLSAPFFVGTLLSGAISLVIGLFILFQVRDYYTGKAKLSPEPKTAEVK